MTVKKRLAIIGGGLAGMISARVARSSNRYSKIRVFERGSNYGGNWNPKQDTGETGVYRDLKTNLPTILMGDPTFPWKNEWRSECFPHHTEFRNYIFRMYFNHLDEVTRQSFRFESQVENVFKNDSGQYQVVTSNSETEEEFDQVIVATGHFDRPFIPEPFTNMFEDPSRRDETVFHSKNWDEYRDRLDGRDVVLVGMGPSGIDLAGFLSEDSARTLHWCHPSFHDLPENARDARVKFWGQIDAEEENIIRLTRKEESQKLYVANDIDDNNLALVFATGYKYNHTFLHPSLRPQRDPTNDLGGKTGIPTQNLACNYILKPGELCFIGMANVVVPSTLMYYQALSFVNFDESYYLEKQREEKKDIWSLVQSEFLNHDGERFQPSGLHYTQQAYAHSLLKTLCRAHEKSSQLNESLRFESDLMLSRAKESWQDRDVDREDNDCADYVHRAVSDACSVEDNNKLTSGSGLVDPYKDSFESDLLCAYEVYRCVSEMRAERRLGAFDARKVSSSSDVLTALTRKDYAATRFDRYGVRDWGVTGGVFRHDDNDGKSIYEA